MEQIAPDENTTKQHDVVIQKKKKDTSCIKCICQGTRERKRPWEELVQHARRSSTCSTSNPSIHDPTDTSSCA